MGETLGSLFSAANGIALGQTLGIVLAFALAGRLLLVVLTTTLFRLSRHTRSRLDDVILHAITGPVVGAVTLLGALVAYRARAAALPDDWGRLVRGALFVGFALLAYFALYRLIRDLLNWYIRERAARTETRLDDQLLPFLRRLLLVALTAATIITILQFFNIEVGAFVATLGVGSLAVALAAQAALGDTISGVLILFDRPYRIGDRIELPGDKLIGDVTDIGLRTTRILTLDYRMVIVPNSQIANNVVINHAYPDPMLRLDLPIGVAYGTDIRQAKAALLEAIRQVPGVQAERGPDVVFHSFGDWAINLEMRCWINVYADKPRMVDRINEAAYDALNAARIEIPFPQHTLWHRVERDSIPTLRAVFDGAQPDGTEAEAQRKGS